MMKQLIEKFPEVAKVSESYYFNAHIHNHKMWDEMCMIFLGNLYF